MVGCEGCVRRVWRICEPWGGVVRMGWRESGGGRTTRPVLPTRAAVGGVEAIVVDGGAARCGIFWVVGGELVGTLRECLRWWRRVGQCEKWAEAFCESWDA